MGENNIFDKLFVMDKFWDFANFLAVSRKFNFTCLYVFQTMYPMRSNWQMILSHTKIFNICPGSYKRHLSLKFCLLIATGTLMNTFPTETFG